MPDKPQKKRIEYVPPSDEVINKFAKDVCKALAEKRNDPSINTPEIIYGFADFMRLVARIEAKRRTKEANEGGQEKTSDD